MPIISTYDTDEDLTGLDKVLGTDYATGQTKNFPLQLIYDSVTTSASSIFKTRTIEVEEELGKDFVAVINASAGFTIQTGEVAFVVVNEIGGAYKATYVMIRPSVTEAVTYGITETQVVAGDFLLLRTAEVEAGEANTISSAGGSYVLAGTKSGVDLPIKGLSVGAGMAIVDNGTHLTISSSITQAEINTLGTAGAGTSLVDTKSGSELRIKTITVPGGNVTDASSNIEIKVWDRSTETTDFTLDSDNDKTTIFVNNGLNDVDITIPSGLASDFACAIVQLGTGNVTLVESGTTVLGSDMKIEGENKQAWLEKSPVGSDNFIFLGNTKA
jgi:hypothetical protein